MSADKSEWDGIFFTEGPEQRAVMSIPPRVKATKKLVHEVSDALGLDYLAAIPAADWIADKMERFGATSAQPVFDMDGNGPLCSWCGVIWPLCGHHHLSLQMDESSEQAS